MRIDGGDEMKFALAGNPNCGKTTLFNALTGSTAHVGNWPGVTVDKKEGVYKALPEKPSIVDLPGIYSLSPYTPEEVIARNYILDEKPDGIINIVDATNLERNLYLTTQILEMDVPVIVALNMMDEVEKRGDTIDVKLLEKALGVPVVAVSALKESGIHQLMERAVKLKPRKGSLVVASALGDKLDKAAAFYTENGESSPLFHAVKLLEGDELELGKKGAKAKLAEIAGKGEDDLMALVADARYSYISEHFSVSKKKTQDEVLTKSDKADKVLTHRVWGIPIFLVILFAIFHLTFSENFLFLGGLFSEVDPSFAGTAYEGLIWTDAGINAPGVIFFNLFDMTFSLIIDGVGSLISIPWLQSFICDGVLSGIFAVLGFLPQILFLFLGFSILEDTGYMARIAFILDRIFRKFGLSGRAFMPMIMGFGCGVPAMINTRTLADEKERTATVRVIPFFSCGAKLPILTAMAGGIVTQFGVGNADLITYAMYLIGVVSAIVCVLLMRNTTQKGETPPFIMELPAYHLPGAKNLVIHLWDKAKHFVKKAFTIIFASTVIIWFLQSFSWNWEFLLTEVEEVDGLVNLRSSESILGGLGMLIQPLFTPLGFGSQLNNAGWVFAAAAITGLVAKENVIATFGVLAAAIAGAYIDPEEQEGVTAAVAMIEATGITIPAVLSFIAFNMTTIPCFAACATAKAELPKGQFRWTLLFWFVASYIVGSVIYTVGSWWWTVFIWLAVAGVVTALIVLNNKGIVRFDKFFKSAKKRA
jgi:ferrous iron transport protein B